ncbi:protein of unknown function [Georgfuchsia toluolica]|uniref:Uncharacterized protein n=1 Tax=Georgfuchsia toluolica TaxID=424218 RepID=A0A916J9F4_9PROT|nr:protein of unknown function [Georgfuchsia toluolica]
MFDVSAYLSRNRYTSALIFQQELSVLPATALLANQILDRYFDVVEEYLIYIVIPTEGNYRLDTDARRLHIDQNEADTVL